MIHTAGSKKWKASIVVLMALCAEVAQRVDAHEKWFIDARAYPLRLDLLLRPLPLSFVSAVLVVTAGAAVYWHSRQRGFVPGPAFFGATDVRRSTLYGLVPLILGIHIAVPLLVNGVQGELFSQIMCSDRDGATSWDWPKPLSRSHCFTVPLPALPLWHSRSCG